jgi:hypothetical protein
MPDDFDALFEDVANKIGMIVEMTQTAIKRAEPEVDWVIKTKSKDTKLIESLLDRLMDYSLQCADDGLPLFKKLLRYYLPINPPAVAEYSKCYHEPTTPLEDDCPDV